MTSINPTVNPTTVKKNENVLKLRSIIAMMDHASPPKTIPKMGATINAFVARGKITLNTNMIPKISTKGM